ncbi:MAG: hypothetical protein Q4E67_02515 [Planctomycetia bacterium]|nr:hypothetical protein [Planctomycetia bacterium]
MIRWGIVCLVMVGYAWGQEEIPSSVEVASYQQKIQEDYRVLEETLLRMAEILSVTDPQRSTVLTRVMAQSREKMVASRMETAGELLREETWGKALEVQREVVAELKKLLTLLESENRSSKVRQEKERLRAYLREIHQRIREQQSLYGRTEEGQPMESLGKEQAEIARKTGELARKMTEESEAEKGSQTESSSEESSAKNAEEGKEEGSQDGDSSQHLRLAQRRMEEAKKRLQEARRAESAQEQQKALQELEQAKANLEEVLRQLREEEAKRYLALLETRLRKMQQMQRTVYDETLRLDKIEEEKRTYEHTVEATRLSRRELDIAAEGDKALLLLREEGTARMFPEVMEQMTQDMRRVSGMLAKGSVGKNVQVIEEDILATLEEMLAAVEKSQKEIQEQSKNPPSGSSMGEMDPALIDRLSEIKMIRASQLRVNRRTEMLEKWIQEKNVADEETESALRDLSRQQERIRQITRELGLQRNR